MKSKKKSTQKEKQQKREKENENVLSKTSWEKMFHSILLCAIENLQIAFCFHCKQALWMDGGCTGCRLEGKENREGKGRERESKPLSI